LKKVLKYEFRPLNTLFKTGVLFSMKKNTVKVQDSWLGFGGRKTYSYYSYQNKDSYSIEYDPEGWEDDIFSLYMVEEETEQEYKREVVTFVDVIEGLGGFLQIIVMISAVLV